MEAQPRRGKMPVGLLDYGPTTNGDGPINGRPQDYMSVEELKGALDHSRSFLRGSGEGGPEEDDDGMEINWRLVSGESADTPGLLIQL